MADPAPWWRAHHPVLGAWLSIPSAVSAEAVARHGFDYVSIDLQHGAIDASATVAMVQAVELGGSTPVVRVPANEPSAIGKALDAGAHAVIVPLVDTAADAADAVAAGHYPPAGRRSWGPSLVAPRHGGTPDGYRAWADRNVAIIPMIETAAALADLDGILATPGVDVVYVGPADLSLSLGLEPTNNDGVAAFDDALATVVAACRRHGVAAGIHATGALAARRAASGFGMITVATDLAALRSGLAAESAAASSP